MVSTVSDSFVCGSVECNVIVFATAIQLHLDLAPEGIGSLFRKVLDRPIDWSDVGLVSFLVDHDLVSRRREVWESGLHHCCNLDQFIACIGLVLTIAAMAGMFLLGTSMDIASRTVCAVVLAVMLTLQVSAVTFFYLGLRSFLHRIEIA